MLDGPQSRYTTDGEEIKFLPLQAIQPQSSSPYLITIVLTQARLKLPRKNKVTKLFHSEYLDEGDDYEERCLLGYDAVQSVRTLPNLVYLYLKAASSFIST